MKTKYLIAMLAAPMFFTACNQDELTDSVPGAEKIEGTPYGDQLVFSVGDNDGASSRVTTAGAWETGDRVGMAWITDGYHNGTTDVAGSFNEMANATKVLSNVPLNFVSGEEFKSNTMMFVGTYVAYYPFNEKLNTASELNLSVGANQTSKDLADAYNKMIFASDTLSLQAANAGTGKTPKITMKRLSNMLALDICLKADVAKMPNPVILKVELDLQDDSNNSLLATSGTVVPKFWIATNTIEAGKIYFRDLGASDTYLTPADLGMITATATDKPAVGKDVYSTVYLSFMPSVLSAIDATSSVINIYTNYGVIKSDAAKWFNMKADGSFEAAATIAAAFGSHTLVAGRTIKKKVEIDLTKVSVNNLTATNAAEILDIVKNWKMQGTPVATTINVTHDAAYEADFAKLEDSGKTCKNINLAGLDLSDIPAALTIVATDTLEFTGATNLKATNAITVAGTTAVKFNGVTTIGTLTANGGIAFNENTTISGTLTQAPADAKDLITVAVGKTLTVDGGNVVSNTADKSKIVNSGTINLINSGSINKGILVAAAKLAITNFTIKKATPLPATYNKGTINIGDADSQGFLAGTTDALFDNTNGFVRFFNGEFVAPVAKPGSVLAVAQNALQFLNAITQSVSTIEVTGEIKFNAIEITEIQGKATKVVMKSGSKLDMGTKTITLGGVEVAENATIAGTKLIVFGGNLEVKAGATLTVADNTEINAFKLILPTDAAIAGNATTSKVIYKSAGQLGGAITAKVTEKSDLNNVG